MTDYEEVLERATKRSHPITSVTMRGASKKREKAHRFNAITATLKLARIEHIAGGFQSTR